MATPGFHRCTFGNLALTDNLNLNANNWTPFTIAATRVWLNPLAIQTGRYVRFGAQFTF